MILDLMHEDVVKIGIPKMKDDCITIIDDFSHSLDICNAMILLKGLGCSWKSDFSCCKYRDKIVSAILVDGIKLGMLIILNFELLFLNSVLLRYLFQNGLVWNWLLINSRECNGISACRWNEKPFYLLSIITFLLVVILIMNVQQSLGPT